MHDKVWHGMRVGLPDEVAMLADRETLFMFTTGLT
jgi:hypothetical protein